MKIKHTGASPHRLKDNRIEQVLSRAWEQENNPPAYMNGGHGILELLVASKGDGRPTRDITQEEATAAASAIQWLGSPVGFGWLTETLAKAGHEVVKK